MLRSEFRFPIDRGPRRLLATLLGEAFLGFLAIIAFSWFNEFVDLRSLIFRNHPYIADYRESALEMLLVLAVWFRSQLSIIHREKCVVLRGC